MRLFTALDIPADIAGHLEMIQGGIPGAHWVTPENMHLTLRFIGDVDTHLAEDLDSLLAGIRSKPFAVTVSGVGLFGSPPRVVWAGIKPSDRLTALVEKVDSVLGRLRIPYDKRRYAPHITLARLGGVPEREVHDFVVRNSALSLEPFPVGRFILYSSMRTHEGPQYTPERYYLF